MHKSKPLTTTTDRSANQTNPICYVCLLSSVLQFPCIQVDCMYVSVPERGNKLSITRFRGFLSDRQCKQSIPFHILIQNYRTLCSSSAPPTTNNLNDCSLWAQTFSISQVCVGVSRPTLFIFHHLEHLLHGPITSYMTSSSKSLS